MSRYNALADYLKRRKGSAWDASFEEIESILGGKLPQSAFRYPAWWANQTGPGHSQTAGWRSVGWRTAKLDLERRRVRFEKEIDTASITAADNDRLFAEARSWTGIDDQSALVREALRALIAREASARLARLGGTMPDYTAPPRERRGS
jgi:hypothetical protein